MVPADDALRSALDRLSVSLDRIHGLLGELYSAQQRAEPPRPVARREGAHASGEVNSAGPDALCKASTHRDEPRVRADEPRIVYGGGPSAFTAR